MYQFVHRFIATSSVCQRTKRDTQAPKAPLLPLPIAEAPMQFVSIDIAVLPPDDSGFKYILLIGDVFSKYIEAVPMKDQNATTVCRAFREAWIFKHGSPYFLLSDQGSNVDGNLIHELCAIFNIEKRRSSAYHSQGNGFAERSIGNIREVLRSLLLDRDLPQKKWRLLLPEVVFALNTSESSFTKCTPYFIVF